MKIGVFTYGMNTSLTGIGRYTVELTRALCRVRPDLEIVLLNPYPDSPEPWYREFETYPLPALRAVPLAATLGNAQLHRAACKLRLDVLHDPCGIAPFLAPRAAYKRVTTVHDAIPLVYPRTQPLATRLIFKSLIPAARFSTDAVITVSDASARDLARRLRLPPRLIHVTPLGVRPPPARREADVAAALARLGVSAPYFLYVGALHPRKNLGGVLAAFERLRRRAPGVNLVIVGPASWGWAARQSLGQAHRLEAVHFSGYVSDEDLHALYYGALALVFPSLYEGFGLPALEAMAHGTPVITSSTSSLPEVVGDAALTVDPTDLPGLQQAMERVLHSPGLREALRHRGLERARTFTWEQTARQTLEVYRQVLGTGR